VPKFTDAQVHAIVRGPRGFREYDLPGAAGIRVAVRVLSDAECDDARVEAQTKLRSIADARKWDPVSMTDIDPEHLTRLTQRRIIFRAYYDCDTTSGEPEKAERFFPTHADVDSLDTTTIERYFQLYLEHQQWVAPLRSADEEGVRALADALGKELDGSVFLSGYEASTLRSLCISLARALHSTSPTIRSSTG
jgi:hypothetical protein